QLDTASIYRGNAVTAMREFLDLSGISMDRLVYNSKVMRDLQANIWTLIEQPEQCLSANIKLHRRILFSGMFGSGKTLAALVTAKKAVACGWTFIYLEPTVDQASGAINFVLDFASKYQRAVVFIEDVDREQRHNDSFALGRIMTAIDGVISKNQEVIVIMTTNYADRLAAGIQRPGRIDKIINFDRFYAEDVEKLLRIVIPSEFLSSDIDWAEIVKSCAGYTPAFVNEVGVGAKLAAISEAGGVTPRVTQQMLTELASDLQVQYKACSAESVGFKR
ncbi:MAG: ATP-binding protein, partial [Candidatus Paceibacterota bacterium]